MIDLNEMLNAVCVVRGKDSNGIWRSANAAFIDPGRVMTSWHVMTGLTEVEFIGSDGEVTTMKRGVKQHKIEEYDLAIVQLARPIGKDFVFPRTPGPDLFNPQRLYMLTKYYNATAAHPVVIRPEMMRSPSLSMTAQGEHPTVLTLTNYITSAHVQPGYSGSAIIDEQGHIVSVVTAMNPQDMSDPRPQNDGLMEFYAPHPDDVARFARNVLFPERAPT